MNQMKTTTTKLHQKTKQNKTKKTRKPNLKIKCFNIKNKKCELNLIFKSFVKFIDLIFNFNDEIFFTNYRIAINLYYI